MLTWLQGLEGLAVEPVVDEDTFARLLSQCELELERDVLRAIRDRGSPLPDAAQEIICDTDGGPLAIADFYYPRRRAVVFVDGSPHHLDYVQTADDRKRRRLKALGHRVVVMRGKELEAGLGDLAGRLSW